MLRCPSCPRDRANAPSADLANRLLASCEALTGGRDSEHFWRDDAESRPPASCLPHIVDILILAYPGSFSLFRVFFWIRDNFRIKQWFLENCSVQDLTGPLLLRGERDPAGAGARWRPRCSLACPPPGTSPRRCQRTRWPRTTTMPISPRPPRSRRSGPRTASPRFMTAATACCKGFPTLPVAPPTWRVSATTSMRNWVTQRCSLLPGEHRQRDVQRRRRSASAQPLRHLAARQRRQRTDSQ